MGKNKVVFWDSVSMLILNLVCKRQNDRPFRRVSYIFIVDVSFLISLQWCAPLNQSANEEIFVGIENTLSITNAVMSRA